MVGAGGQGQLSEKFELCQAYLKLAKARVETWEKWADGELEAQRKGRQ